MDEKLERLFYEYLTKFRADLKMIEAAKDVRNRGTSIYINKWYEKLRKMDKSVQPLIIKELVENEDNYMLSLLIAMNPGFKLERRDIGRFKIIKEKLLQYISENNK
jgi:hypothetical protein